MTFLTRKMLTRRTVLKGVGATVALPLLDAMMPVLSAQTRQAPMRLGFVYGAHGVIHSEWKPHQTGRTRQTGGPRRRSVPERPEKRP